MTPVHRWALLAPAALAVAVGFAGGEPGPVASAKFVGPPAPARPPAETALAAVVDANWGRLPATGEELWAALGRVGSFAQLSVPFSAVRLASGLDNPRVVIAPRGTGESRADVTGPNVDGRLFLAATMEPRAGRVPRVTAVEFISWNARRRQFDFGVIDRMGEGAEPELRFVDGGKCFACHKNRGPILGVRPWSNTSHDDILRFATASLHRLTGTGLPEAGPFALPRADGAVALRDRVDGMALAVPEAPAVDAAVRFGAGLRTDREVFRLMATTPEGRRALVALFLAVAGPGPLDPDDPAAKKAVDTAFGPAAGRFLAGCADVRKRAKPSGLLDTDPAELLVASGIRRRVGGGLAAALPPTVSVPGLFASGSRWVAVPYPTTVPQEAFSRDPDVAAAGLRVYRERKAANDFTLTLNELSRYDGVRSMGFHGLTSKVQPSNPKAFARPPAGPAPKRPSDVVNPALLARTVGLTDGDRRFLARSLAGAADRAAAILPDATAAGLARAVFEGPEFAPVLAGGPLPDRDEFKDRFAAGLGGVLRTRYLLADGFAPDRRAYASGPPYDPAAGEEKEAAVLPTTACLRCHEVSASGRASRFDPIPPLAFDPFDKPGRAAWVRDADPNRRREVLARLVERLATDADMPPADAPEHDLFRVKDAAGFGEAKRFLTAELARAKGR